MPKENESVTTKTKTKKLWGLFNYDVLWSVGETRYSAKYQCALELVSGTRYIDKGIREVEQRLKNGSFTLRRITVLYEV